MSDEFQSLLIKSESLKSLRDEVEIRDTLMQSGWESSVGCIYEDPITGKTREADAVGKKHWKSEQNGLMPHVILLAESKSMNGYHVVFAESPSPKSPEFLSNCHRSWLGHLNHNQQDVLAESLERAGLEMDDIDEVFDSMETMAHPNGFVALINEFCPEPPDAHAYATSFKETNTKTDKDEDNSVLWRACTALTSIKKSFSAGREKEFIGEMISAARRGRRKGDIVFEMKEAYSFHLSHLMILHPIVVVDATLWISNGTKVAEVPSCRLLQQSLNFEMSWFDVVQRAHLKKYVEDMNTHYSSYFEARGCKEMKGLI